jgi:hypothetical protein
MIFVSEFHNQWVMCLCSFHNAWCMNVAYVASCDYSLCEFCMWRRSWMSRGWMCRKTRGLHCSWVECVTSCMCRSWMSQGWKRSRVKLFGVEPKSWISRSGVVLQSLLTTTLSPIRGRISGNKVVATSSEEMVLCHSAIAERTLHSNSPYLCRVCPPNLFEFVSAWANLGTGNTIQLKLSRFSALFCKLNFRFNSQRRKERTCIMSSIPCKSFNNMARAYCFFLRTYTSPVLVVMA